MKHSIYNFILLFSALSLVLSSCEPTETNESDDARDTFVGVWRFVESNAKKSTNGQSYLVNIKKDPSNSSQVLLENFANPGSTTSPIYGIVTANQIVVPKQNTSNNWEVEGTGKLSNTTKTEMSWNFSILSSGDKEYFTAIASRQ